MVAARASEDLDEQLHRVPAKTSTTQHNKQKQTMSELRERLLAFDEPTGARPASRQPRAERDNEVVAQEQPATFYSKDASTADKQQLTTTTIATAADELLHSNRAEEQRERIRQRRKRATRFRDEETSQFTPREEAERFVALGGDGQSDQHEELAARGASDERSPNNQRSQVTQQVGSSSRVAAAGSQPPLIHTDQLNTTTRLLYIYPPPTSTDSPHRHILANTPAYRRHNHNNHQRASSMSQRRRQRQHWRDQAGQMVAAASESSATNNQVARLEVLNLEVTNSTATLTWALSVVPGEQVAAVGRRNDQDQKNGFPSSDDPELSRELKTLRSIAKRDTDSVMAGLGPTTTMERDRDELDADTFATPPSSESERDKRLWIGPRGRVVPNKQVFRVDDAPLSTTTTDLDDILRNHATGSDTPTIATTANTRRPATEPNAVEALPASSVGPTRRPPNRNRKPTPQASTAAATATNSLGASTSWREPRTTKPVTQTAQTTMTTTSTTTTSKRPVAMTTTKSLSAITSQVRPVETAETLPPKVDVTSGPTNLPTGMPRTARPTIPVAITNNLDRHATETDPPIVERMASVPLNRLQPISSTTKAAPGLEGEDKTRGTTMGSTQPALPSTPARVTSTSMSVSVSAVTTTTRQPAGSQRVPTTLDMQQTPTTDKHDTTTRMGKSVRFEPGPETSVAPSTSGGTTGTTLLSTTSGEPTISTTTTAPPTTTMKPISATGSPPTPATNLFEETTTTRRPDVNSAIVMNASPSTTATSANGGLATRERHETAMASTTRGAVEFVSPAQNAAGTQPDSTATPTSTTLTTPTDRTATTNGASPVISMSKSQLVTSESLKQKELDRSKQVDEKAEATTRATNDEVGPSRVTQSAGEQRPPPMSSKWLVRLRRFGSNEVDIVKVVVSDLDRLLPRDQQPLQRSISFKNLDPSSGYEICVESASPNQIISDKFHILNANPFLKCHDVSDVELSDSSSPGNNSTALGSSGGQESLRRMDLRLDGQQVVADNYHNLLSLNSTTKSQLPPSKMKSLCREFFTLATSDQRVASAQFVAAGKVPTNSLAAAVGGDQQLAVGEQSAGQPRRPKSLAGQQQQQVPAGALRSHVELMEIGGSSAANESQWRPSTSTFEMFASSSGNRGLPVSMGSADLSRDLRSNNNNLGALPSLVGNETTTSILATNRSLPSLTGSSGTNKLFGEGTHIVPIVGCVFVLIFLATIANMLLNLLHCDAPPRSRSSSDSAADMLAAQSGAGGRLSRHLAGHRDDRRRRRRRRQRLTDALGGLGPATGSRSPTTATQTGNLTTLRSPAHQLLSSTPTLLAGHHNRAHHHQQHHKHQRHFSNSLSGSYYSNASDQSATSKSRIVVVGKNGEPFGSAAGYFDVPPERHLSPVSVLLGSPASPLLRASPAGGGGDNNLANQEAANQTASVYMLSSAVRFPLGPSFEGDEKHNADMVGLARRNYDNFINNIYNADEHTMSALLANGELNSGRHQSNSHANGGCSADNQYQQVVVSSTLQEARARNAAASTTTGTAPAQNRQRLRFDKVNPIYNMDGIQQHQHRMSQQLASFGQPSPTRQLDSTANSPANQEDQCSLCDQNLNGHSAATCEAASQSPASSRSSGSTTSGLDKQKQRFQAQQQQLERVVGKSGSLVPQPFINVSSEVGSEAESHAYSHRGRGGDGHSTTDNSMDNLDDPQASAAEFMFGDHLPRPPSARELPEQLESNAPTPPPPPPPAPLSPVGGATAAVSVSPTPPPNENRQASKSVVGTTTTTTTMKQQMVAAGSSSKETKTTTKDKTNSKQGGSPLVNLQAIGGGGPQTGPNETIDKSDFAQRRNELASKLHLPGMTK